VYACQGSLKSVEKLESAMVKISHLVMVKETLNPELFLLYVCMQKNPHDKLAACLLSITSSSAKP
jgi:hypothetical protein